MRKIEQQMLEAIRSRKDWTSGNTRVDSFFVQSEKNGKRSGSNIHLHGNHIATQFEDQAAVPNRATFRQWPTTTTRSRLRALGIDASIRKGVAYIAGQPC